MISGISSSTHQLPIPFKIDYTGEQQKTTGAIKTVTKAFHLLSTLKTNLKIHIERPSTQLSVKMAQAFLSESTKTYHLIQKHIYNETRTYDEVANAIAIGRSTNDSTSAVSISEIPLTSLTSTQQTTEQIESLSSLICTLDGQLQDLRVHLVTLSTELASTNKLFAAFQARIPLGVNDNTPIYATPGFLYKTWCWWSAKPPENNEHKKVTPATQHSASEQFYQLVEPLTSPSSSTTQPILSSKRTYAEVAAGTGENNLIKDE